MGINYKKNFIVNVKHNKKCINLSNGKYNENC